MPDNSLLILSIKPQYAEKVFSGEKNIEMRKVKPKRLSKNSIIILYVSSPVKKILGFCIVKKIDIVPIDSITNSIMKDASIEKTFLEKYYFDSKYAVLIYLGTRHIFKTNFNLSNFTAPQGFRYTSHKETQLFLADKEIKKVIKECDIDISAML